MSGGRLGRAALALSIAWVVASSRPSAVLAAAAESAEVRQRVVVEVANDAQGMLPLLRAELHDLGLDVVVRATADARAPSSSVWQEDPLAAFRIVVNLRTVEVWVFDRTSNTIALHEVFAQADGSPLSARTAVLHAVELLGWSLRERQQRETPAPAPTRTSPSPSIAPPPERHKEWFVAFTPLMLHSPGGTKPGAGAAIELTWRQSQLGLRLAAATLLWPNQLTQPEGKLEALPRWIGLQTVLFANAPTAQWNTILGVGVNLLGVYLRGTTDLDLQVHEDTLVTVAPSLDVRSYYALGDAISLGLLASGMTPLRADVIRIDEREVGRYGRLLLTVGVGLQASLQ